jgi:AcrR family transcriptional regulator
MSAAAPARRGRPRDDAAEGAIVQAVVELLAEQGFTRLTIAAVAARAGVGKPTIYRRWSSKSDLVVDAIVRVAPPISARRTGDPHTDLRNLTHAAIKDVTSPPLGATLVAVLAQTGSHNELGTLVQHKLAQPRREVLHEVIVVAIESGQLRADTDAELMLDLLLGPGLYRWLITGRPVSRAMTAGVVDAVWNGFAAGA